MTRLEGSSVSSPNPGPTSARTAEDLSWVPTYSRSERCSVALLRYAVAEVFRGRRRTVSSLIGIALAVTFVSGTFIAIDSSLRAIVEEQFKSLQADLVVLVDTDRPAELARDLKTPSGVVSVAPFVELPLDAAGRWTRTPVSAVEAIALDPQNLPTELLGVGLRGTMGLSRGNVVVSDLVASEMGATIGDVIYLSATANNPVNGSSETRFVNLTIEGIVSIPPQRPDPSFGSNTFSRRFLAVHLLDATSYAEVLSGRKSAFAVNEVFVDRNAFANPYDPDASRRNLVRLQRELQDIAAPFALGPYSGATVANLLSYVLENLGNALTVFRGMYLLLSMPIVVLGISLGAVGVELGHAERRRELAILKARGAAPRQVSTVLVLESVILGAVAAVIGLIAGVGVSRLIMPFATFFVTTTPRFEDVVLNPSSFGISVAFSVLLAFVAGYRSARRAAKSPIVENLRFFAPEEKRLEYRRTTDVVLVTIGFGTLAIDLLAAVFRGSLLGLFVAPVVFVLLPIAPFLLLIGLTRFLTRSTPCTYEVIARLLKRLAKNLEHVISRNLALNPKRASHIAVLIALGVAFGIFILALNQSFILREDGILRASIGADISGLAPVGDQTFNENLSRISGVARVALLVSVSAQPSLGTSSGVSADVFALDPDAYFSTIVVEPWYFVDGNPDSAHTILASPGSVVVSEAVKNRVGLEAGEKISLYYPVVTAKGQAEAHCLEVSVGGFVRGLPGLPSSSDFLPSAIYGSTITLDPILSAEASAGTTSRPTFIVALTPGADWRESKASILGLGASEVRVYQEEQAMTNRNPAARNVLGFFTIELGFVLAILTAGLALITYASSLEREVEFAGMIARGASGWQAATILLGEAFSILVIGTLVGLGTGALAAYGGARILGPGPGGEAYAPLVPFLFVVPLEALLVVGLAFLVMFLASLAVAWRIARMDVPRVLRLRAG